MGKGMTGGRCDYVGNEMNDVRADGEVDACKANGCITCELEVGLGLDLGGVQGARKQANLVEGV
jgi:hypothetical protein